LPQVVEALALGAFNMKVRVGVLEGFLLALPHYMLERFIRSMLVAVVRQQQMDQFQLHSDLQQ
jgi:hypothetical protein